MGSPFGEVTRKSTVNKGKSHPFLPGTEEETPLQTDISLINVNVSYKMGTCTQFSDLILYLLFFKKKVIKLPKVILMPKRHILE